MSDSAEATAPAPVPTPNSTGPATPALIATMLNFRKGVSDLILSPGRPPQVEVHGSLVAVPVEGLAQLMPADTARVAADLVGTNKQAVQALKEQGSCDTSYSLPRSARFRVNIFKQRGTYAIVMRVIPGAIPTLESLELPAHLGDIAYLKDGLVLVTGPTGSGKSSTLAAIISKINHEKAYHIVTIEDPVEFLHPHAKSTIHQRELHTDTPSFALALRAALRQAPKVILVGEMRDRETMEIALTAAETGHLVFSTLHTIDAAKTVERIIGAFPLSDQQAIRVRLSATFRYFISQRLMPRIDREGRIAVLEVLKSTLRTRTYIERPDEGEGKSLLDAMRDGGLDNMQHFDGEIERLVRAGILSLETGLLYATNPGNLRLQLADFGD